MALARLAACYAKRAGVEVHAACVDHGLRAGSADEAERVAGWCAAIGLDCLILAWTGEKPTSGVQAAARAARYRLLCDAARRKGCGAILTGHTADDQAETVFMRMAKGAGPRGMAGMAARTLIADGPADALPLLRPFLGVERKRLAATLAGFGQACLRDPSNADTAFERVRVRALLAALAEQGLLTREGLLRTAGAARLACAALDAAESRALNRVSATFHRWGGVSLKSSFAEQPSAALLFRQLIFAVGGGLHPPQPAAAERALAEIAAGGAATLGGAIAERTGETVWLYREPAALSGRAGVGPKSPQKLAAGERLLWDRRFIIENRRPAAIVISTAVDPLAAGPAPFAGPKRAFSSMPFAAETNGSPTPLTAGAGLAGVEVGSLAEERFFRRVIRFS